MYQKLGKEKPWPSQADKGRSGVTKSASDDMMFKVPSLREVVGTGPYFHDGSSTSLEESVKLMAEYESRFRKMEEDFSTPERSGSGSGKTREHC